MQQAAGLPGVLTDIGIDTILGEGKERVSLKGKTFLFEPALSADYALVHAQLADRFGNLAFNSSARNFNPLIAMAARRVIAEVEQLVPAGDIRPDCIHTAAPFVDHLVCLPELSEVYGVLER